ncbi:phosphinothricin acetyltransferase [Leifsonia sp. Leaf325]|nr:GNAT family N-acetyltransferase [Leifsonia sp. Leaf325]KQQ92551.1 phosphinothricin acetyltransferase [Leifsonia sp. Leaf325]
MTNVKIRALEPSDWSAVHAIYAEGIATGHATFEAEPPTWESFDVGKLRQHRMAATLDDVVVGWAVVSPISSRPVYRGVVEHSVYVSAAARGRGIGHLLLAALISSTEDDGIWTLQSGVFPENVASVRLHEAHGFRIVGTRQRLALMPHGPMAGLWRDVYLLERRSDRLAAGDLPKA